MATVNTMAALANIVRRAVMVADTITLVMVTGMLKLTLRHLLTPAQMVKRGLHSWGAHPAWCQLGVSQ